MQKQKNKTIMILFVCISAMLTIYVWNPFSGLNILAQDFLFQKPSKPQSNIFVIGIDEKTLQTIGPWHTWSREKIADMITYLNSDYDNRPAVIGVDIMFFGNSTEKQDTTLSNAVLSTHNIVLASQVLFDEKIKSNSRGDLYKEKLHIIGIENPYGTLGQSATTGFTNVILDSDGKTRNSLLQVGFNGTIERNFAYEIYIKYLESQNITTINTPPVNSIGTWYLPYSAKSGAYRNGLSFIDVKNGLIPKEIFKNAIVIIGPYASGMLDAYYTPIDKSTPMYGAEINANIIQALCEGNFKTKIPLTMQLLFTALSILICHFVFKNYSIILSSITLFLFTIGFCCLSVIFYEFGYLADVIYIPLFTLVLYGYHNIQGYIIEMNQKILILNTFKRYVAPQIVDDIMKDKRSLSVLGGKKRDIAVLFVDIRGFTTMSENLPAESIVEILNDYLTLTSSMVFKNEGTLDKFIGDATMAIYNAPFDQNDYVYKAVSTAYDIAQGSQQLSEKLLEKFGKTVSFGIGINCGDAVVGNIGTEFRMDYTAIGNTVNTAARLESNAKSGQILISEHVYNRLKGRITAVNMGAIPLKGKSENLNVYLLESLSVNNIQPLDDKTFTV